MRWAASVLVGALIAVMSSSADARLVTYQELLARPHQKADQRIRYGADPNQFGDLWLPGGKGPFPVAVLVHGGCWQAGFGLDLMDLMAADLKARGYAVWNIEYRRLSQPGGGYPGTFADAGAAIDDLRVLARTYPLDLKRVVVIGHSAGGHLATWMLGRAEIPADSPLHAADPLIPRGVISLAGINDLAAFRDLGPGSCGEPATVDALLEGSTRRDRYDDTSAVHLVGRSARQVIVAGSADPIVPSALAKDYVAKTGAKLVEIDGAGHFELIDPTSAAWSRIVDEINRAFQP